MSCDKRLKFVLGGEVSMNPKIISFVVLALGVVCLGAPETKTGSHAIDTRKSVITVRVFKSGVLSALGHDHDIAAPIASGTADTSSRHVELRVNANALRVRDEKASDKDREKIQTTMLGPEVLDVSKHAEIAFKSTAAETAGPNTWRVRGDLTIHGQTKPVTLNVVEKAGHYTGSTPLKLTDFGIKPVSVAGGTVKIKDEIRIEFDIQLEP